MSAVLTINRPALYLSVVFGFVLLVAVAGAYGGHYSSALYVCLLFAICASPLLYLDRLNGRYAILCIFLAAYFVFYGALDAVSLITPHKSFTSTGMLSLTEVTILGAALLTIGGYRAATYMSVRRQDMVQKDWPVSAVVLVGLALWLAGTAATWIWQVHFQRNGVEFDTSVGNTAINAAVLGRMVQPLGVLILAYGLVVTRNRSMLLLVVGVLAVQVVVGFIGDSKELGMRGAVLVIVAMFLLEGRIPKAWLVSLGVFAVFAFPVFQAYRAEIIMAQGASRADAAANMLKSVKTALKAQKRVSTGSGGLEDRAQTFLERATLKGNLELILTKVGRSVQFQNGATVWPFFTFFIPRMIWPDKPDSSSGQLFNQEFQISEDSRTYISPTQLGELYWNFGWAGVLVGMPLIGLLLGFVGARCDLSEYRSITRLLVLVVTIYAGCVRFEGSIALEYIVWIRSLGVILIMHWMFARATRPAADNGAAGTTQMASAAVPAFPNLLR